MGTVISFLKKVFTLDFVNQGKLLGLSFKMIPFSNNIFCSRSVFTVTTKESESYAIQQALKPPGNS